MPRSEIRSTLQQLLGRRSFMVTQLSPAVLFFFSFWPSVCSALSLCSASDGSLCLQQRRELRQESLRGLDELVALVDRLKVMESI